MFLLIRHHKVLGMSPDLIQLKKKKQKKTNKINEDSNSFTFSNRTNTLKVLRSPLELQCSQKSLSKEHILIQQAMLNAPRLWSLDSNRKKKKKSYLDPDCDYS